MPVKIVTDPLKPESFASGLRYAVKGYYKYQWETTPEVRLLLERWSKIRIHPDEQTVTIADLNYNRDSRPVGRLISDWVIDNPDRLTVEAIMALSSKCNLPMKVKLRGAQVSLINELAQNFDVNFAEEENGDVVIWD
ncbi:MAG TPA: hypothetical protein PKD57_14715 [Saprospiraceae bacterium]|nr:hypothetical protein [Saprospiraceae bacterium]